MPTTPLVGQREMPDFSIMGLLLGGSGYASQWYSQRDQLRLVDQEEQRRGAAAQRFVQTPEFNVWMDHPDDRRAAFGAWKMNQGTPLATQGADWLNESLTRIGNQDTTRLQSQLQANNIKLSAEQQLWVEQKKADMEQQHFADTVRMTQKMISPGQAQDDATYDLMSKQLGWKERSAGESVVVDQNGQMSGFVPNPNNPKYQDMMKDVSAAKEFAGTISEMSDMMDAAASQGRGFDARETGRFQALAGLSVMGVKEMYTAGSLDEGLLNFMKQIQSPYGEWKGFGAIGSGNWTRAREKMRVLDAKAQRNIIEKGFKWSVPIEKMPDAGYYKPGGNIKKPFDPTRPAPPAARPVARRDRLVAPRSQAWFGSPGGGGPGMTSPGYPGN